MSILATVWRIHERKVDRWRAAEFEKSNIFIFENLLTIYSLTIYLKKIGAFLNFLEFCKISHDFYVFIFLWIFLGFLEHSRKIKKFKKISKKCQKNVNTFSKMLENSRNLKCAPNCLGNIVKFRRFSKHF